MNIITLKRDRDKLYVNNNVLHTLDNRYVKTIYMKNSVQQELTCFHFNGKGFVSSATGKLRWPTELKLISGLCSMSMMWMCVTVDRWQSSFFVFQVGYQ